MHHMSKTQIENSNQPLNLSQPSKLKAKLSARHHAMSGTTRSSTSPSSVTKPKARMGSHHHHNHHHHYHHHHSDIELSCSCPQLDSKNTILYRLLTESYSYRTPVCCIGGKCHDGQILGQSKLKILLEENVRGLSSTSLVETLQGHAQLQLSEYVTALHPSDPLRFAHLLLSLPPLRNVRPRVITQLFFRELIGDVTMEEILQQMLTNA